MNGAKLGVYFFIAVWLLNLAGGMIPQLGQFLIQISLTNLVGALITFVVAGIVAVYARNMLKF